MAKNKAFRLPKRINGYKLPKPARKSANRFLKRVQGPELEALIGVVLGAMAAHVAEKGSETKLSQRLTKAVGDHLTH